MKLEHTYIVEVERGRYYDGGICGTDAPLLATRFSFKCAVAKCVEGRKARLCAGYTSRVFPRVVRLSITLTPIKPSKYHSRKV